MSKTKVNPLKAYHKALRQAETIRGKRMSAADKAYWEAYDKAWEKYKAAGGK